MALADFGAIAGALACLGLIALFMYKHYIHH